MTGLTTGMPNCARCGGTLAPDGRVRSYRPAVPGLLLLCTDGLWRHLPHPDDLRAVLPRRPDGGRLPSTRALVARALAAGGEDNITALLMPVTVDG